MEPEWCTELLFDAIEFKGGVYDPAMGRGNILNVATRKGFYAYGSDIVRRCGRGVFTQGDFLEGPMLSHQNIITNPPYKLAQQFIERAFDVAEEKIAVLVQLGFLASQKRKRELFNVKPPTHTLVLSRRPSMPPGNKYDPEKEARGGTIDYCWLVWDLTTDERHPMEWLL